MLIKEFRIPVPIKRDEYQIGQLFAVAEASMKETGGGEGVEVLANEPYTDANGSGQYTKKIYRLESKVPSFIRMVAPAGSLELVEEAWNAYPYCRTVLKNTYMKDKFTLEVVSLHVDDDTGNLENVHKLEGSDLKKREVVKVDIATDSVSKSDYKADEDPTLVRSEKAQRGPLAAGWQVGTRPVMCCYKFVRIEFKWFGLQSRVESFIASTMQNLFLKFHRQLFCWLDKWYGMSLQDIRDMEERIKKELDEKRKSAEKQGTTASE